MDETAKEESAAETKEDPFGGLAPRDETKFKRDLKTFHPSRADPPTVLRNKDQGSSSQLVKQEDKSKTENKHDTEHETVINERKAREEGDTEKKDAGNGKTEERKERIIEAPKMEINPLNIDAIRGLGSRDKAISTVEGDAN